MPIAWWGLLGLFTALLINRAADCWLSPARLQCGLTRHPIRQGTVVFGVPVLFMALAWVRPNLSDLWAVCLFAAALILLAIIDGEQRRVPNIVLLPATVLALWQAWQNGDLLPAAVGGALAFVAFLVLLALGRRLYGPGALGMGDVKLAGLIGTVIGLEGMPYALVLGIVLAGAAAIWLLLTGRARRGDTLPYGAFMALAAVVALVIGL